MSSSKVTNPVLSEQEEQEEHDSNEENKKISINSSTDNAITDPSLVQDSNTIDTTDESLKTDQAYEWQAVWDNDVQAYYYWNTVTNETTWEIPDRLSYTGDPNYQGYSMASSDQTLSVTTATADCTEHSEQEYYQYYAQYGYYPEAYNYGYDSTATTAAAVPQEPVNPLETLLDKIDTEVKSKLDGISSLTTSSSSNTSQPQQASSTSATNDDYQYPQADDDSEYHAFLAQHGTDYTLSARFNAKTGKFQRDPTLTPDKFSADAKAIRQMSYFFDYENFAEQRSKKLKDTSSAETKSNKRLNRRDIEFLKQRKKEKKEMKKKAWLMGGE